MRAIDLMTTPVVTIKSDATLGEAAASMLKHRVAALVVLDTTEQIVGMLSHTSFGAERRFAPMGKEEFTLLGATGSADQLEQLFRGLKDRKVWEVMSQDVVTIEETAPFEMVIDTMLKKKVHRLPVIRNGALAGIVTRHDLLKAIVQGEPSAGGESLEDRTKHLG